MRPKKLLPIIGVLSLLSVFLMIRSCSETKKHKTVVSQKEQTIQTLESQKRNLANLIQETEQRYRADSIKADAIIRGLELDIKSSDDVIEKLSKESQNLKKSVAFYKAQTEELKSKLFQTEREIKRLKEDRTNFVANAREDIGKREEVIQATGQLNQELESRLDEAKKVVAPGLGMIFSATWGGPEFIDGYSVVRPYLNRSDSKLIQKLYSGKEYENLRKVARKLALDPEALYQFCRARGIDCHSITENKCKESINQFLKHDFKVWGTQLFSISPQKLDRVVTISRDRFNLN